LDIAGKAAIVTGAGSGIGQAMAVRLASLGARVLVADLDEDGGISTVETIEKAGGTAYFLRTDVGSVDDLTRMVRASQSRWGSLDILHNNAGITTGMPDFPSSELDGIAAVVRTNLLGVILGTHIALPALQQSRGVVVSTASLSGLRPWSNDPVYSATKAAVVFFTQALATQQAASGVRFNCVCPGVVRTPLIGKSIRVRSLPEAERKQFEAAIAAMPLIEPSEVVDALVDQITNDAINGEARHIARAPLPAEGTVIGGVI
jgi:NAD(P)-dependent dehydrogenase (short-subunit alcohol dehydrogenase family)